MDQNYKIPEINDSFKLEWFTDDNFRTKAIANIGNIITSLNEKDVSPEIFSALERLHDTLGDKNSPYMTQGNNPEEAYEVFLEISGRILALELG